MTSYELSPCKVVSWSVPSAMPPFHNKEKGSTLMTLKFSSSGPRPSLNKKRDALPVSGLRASDPRPQFHDPFTPQWCFYELSLNVKLQSHWSCYRGYSLSTSHPILFCCPALWIQGSLSAWKAPEFWYGSLWLCSTQGFIIHNLLKSLPQQLPKIPLVRNAIMRRSGCFVTHTVSLKRFFFSNKFSVEESKGFPKPQ